MTGGGVSDDDMPIFPWSSRGEVPPVGDPAFDALLAGNLLPEDTAGGLRPVAEAIAALNAAPAASELAAEASALTVFSAAGRSGEPTRSRRRRRPLLTSLLSAKLAAAAAVSLGGAAAAAYTGALPAPVQKFAHDTLGAPLAHPGVPSTRPAAPAGPDATGHAAYGLCTAYAHLEAHGSAGQKAVAFRNLAAAAGGAANVTAYCAKVARPGTTSAGEPAAHRTGKPATHPTGKPATGRTGEPAAHHTGEPAAHPTGEPAAHPTGKPAAHPTGKPATLPSQVPASKPATHP
jgi:hypothetical protein